MISTLIVDDESLVRKGLESTIPWSQFDIRIVGEANNGNAALELMRLHSVDLLITDLIMPVMDGFELMDAVRTQFPHTWIVVLTCHQDFDYIQKAMRAGAIDYIVKTQLEDDKLENTLSRVVSRIKSGQAATPVRANQYCGTLLLDTKKRPDLKQVAATVLRDVLWMTAGDDAIYVPPHANFDKHDEMYEFIKGEDGWAMIDIRNSHSVSAPSLVKLLPAFTAKFRFYEYDPSISLYEFSYTDLVNLARVEMEDQARLEEEVWQTCGLLLEDRQYSEMKNKWLSHKIPPEHLKRLAERMMVGWNRIMRSPLFESVVLQVRQVDYWNKFEQLLDGFRKDVIRFCGKFAYSFEILGRMVQILDYMHSTHSFALNRDQISAKFYMSTGYFSQCFRDIVGTSYSDYMKKLQIEKSMELLRDTNYPVYWISEQVGYNDEKYFSKVFRNYTGLTPVKYRKQIGKES